MARMMSCLLVLLCAVLVHSETEEVAEGAEKKITQDEKVECVKKFVKWCNEMQYPEEGGSGLALLSITYRDDEDYYRVFCSSDSDGTNCSRNGSPWFSCAPDHVFMYKGEVLTETTTEVDDDICKTQEKAFNQLFVNKMSYDNSTLSVIEKELKSFFGEILEMRQQMLELQKRLGDGFFTGGDFWGGFDSFPFNNSEEEDADAVKTSDEKNDTNQIERE